MAKKTDAGKLSAWVTLDRIEEGIAVLLTDDGRRISMPASLLPAGRQEGSVLEMTLEVDRAETLRRTERVREMQRRLLEGNG
jgi:antitoxin (DNA-binding transcriptional repressor) of toxin-antitoxin stability system